MSAPSKLGEITSLMSLPYQTMRRQKEQWLLAAELAHLRSQRIRKLLVAAAKAPYYKHLLSGSDAGATAVSLASLPLLDKRLIATHGLDAFLTAGSGGLLPVSTSGSTGYPTRFLRSPLEEAEYSARWYRIYASYGGSPRDTLLNVGRADAKPRSGAVRVMRELGILPRIQNISVAAPVEESVATVEASRPQFITGYANGIENIAFHILRKGISVQPPKAVLCTAMDVSDRCRELIVQAFAAPAVNVYASMEFGVIAWECPERPGSLHVNDDSLVIEVLDDDGRPSPQGVPGEVVVTSLTLTRMPLIRYRTGDTAALLSEPCICGRGLGLMTPIQGRTSHTIVGPQGQLITGPVVASVFSAADAYLWVRRFQLREKENHILTLLVEPHCEPSASQKHELVERLARVVGTPYQIQLELQEELPLPPTGKYQYVVPLDRPSGPAASVPPLAATAS